MKDTNETPTKSTPGPTRQFGPFQEVPCDEIKPAGLSCPECRRQIERAAKSLPGMVPRVLFYACQCVTAVVWEDERQPRNARAWRLVIDLAKASDAKVAIFNGNRPLSPDFLGIN
jgi:hypothetical protein